MTASNKYTQLVDTKTIEDETVGIFLCTLAYQMKNTSLIFNRSWVYSGVLPIPFQVYSSGVDLTCSTS